MNILVIGNGFDLAHGLPTKYTDFLEFCDRIKKIYTLDMGKTSDEFMVENLNNWKINDCIKTQLLDIYEKRIFENNYQEDKISDIQVKTINKSLDELYGYINDNAWVQYFLDCYTEMEKNWIDFELEISKVIQTLDNAKFQVERGGSANNIEENESKILIAILKAAKWSLQNAYRDAKSINNFAEFLKNELERLTRALEIYITEFVGGITITKKSVDIEKINPDHILSFNYSDTYERLYAKDQKIEYDYIHGKADINNSIESNNMVLGIDEYLPKKRRNKELDFIAFKKFYQRIHKQTGCKYREWIDEIKKGYKDYHKKQKDSIYSLKQSLMNGSLDMNPFIVKDCQAVLQEKCPEHNLYIFGHSLDITDKDILKDLILNDNVHTTIFYCKKEDDDGNYDNGKKDLGQKIANLVKVIGQDELIRRTGGRTKTIEFKLQRDMVENSVSTISLD